MDAVYVVAYRHSGAAALVAAGQGRLEVDGLVGLYPMDRYLEQDAVAAADRIDVPLLLIGVSGALAQAAPPGTEFARVEPPVIFTASGDRVADTVLEFIASLES